MRTYTFSLVIYEGNDEFWEGDKCDGTTPRGYATPEEVQELVEEGLSQYGLNNGENYDLKLTKLEVKADE